MKKLLLLCITLICVRVSSAQDSNAVADKFASNGYLKYLKTFSFNEDFSELITGNVIHNRINVKWKPSSKINGTAEFRNRLFWGEEVKLSPDFGSLLKGENEAINMQTVWIKYESMILITNVERLYVDYGNEGMNIRIGRQRINWGLNTTWNPNDIFNSYNFLDFDYEERAGVEAGKLSYLFNKSNAELAYAFTGKKSGSVAAFKYALNKWNYDLQFIIGWYREHPTVGAGWAGSIKDAGFKGEAQYYFARKDSLNHLNLAIEVDYMFSKGWYLNWGMLFNNRGLDKPVLNWNSLNQGLSPANLMPTKWNIIVACAKEITPLLSIKISGLYAPSANLGLLYPSFQYNIATNLDVNLVWQSFYVEQRHGDDGVKHQGILRLKWSF